MGSGCDVTSQSVMAAKLNTRSQNSNDNNFARNNRIKKIFAALNSRCCDL